MGEELNSVISTQSFCIIDRQVEANPTLTAKQIKENNTFLDNAAVRTIQRHLLGYKQVTARKKPLITTQQREKRLGFPPTVTDSNTKKVCRDRGAETSSNKPLAFT